MKPEPRLKTIEELWRDLDGGLYSVPLRTRGLIAARVDRIRYESWPSGSGALACRIVDRVEYAHWYGHLHPSPSCRCPKGAPA